MKILTQLTEFLSSLDNQDTEIDIAIGIATTSYEFTEPYFSFPRVIDHWGYYLHVVCADSAQADVIIKRIWSRKKPNSQL